ncbi:MAG: hypothetical protein H6Q73_1732 [Firmicutes bacterium]|nr:hypothetical protein [Bacillota bacterium]
MWNKRVLLVGMQWDYGIKDRGPSLDQTIFSETLKQLVAYNEVFWFDDYIKDGKNLEESLARKIEETKPDLIMFLLYTEQFSIQFLDQLKQKYQTYGWFGDDQWRFESFSQKYAPHFTYVSTTDQWAVSKYRRLGIEPILTQWAAQRFNDNYGVIDDIIYEYDVSFVGQYNEVRGWFVKKLAQAGINVVCFGAGWDNGRITFEDMENIFRASKINLNISNSVSQDIRFVCGGIRNFARWLLSPKRSEQIKARNFEIPLAGGFQLTNYVVGLERYWRIGEEIAIYSTVEDCAKQVEFYLEHVEIRNNIVAKSYERANREHTYFSRLSHVLEEIWG